MAEEARFLVFRVLREDGKTGIPGITTFATFVTFVFTPPANDQESGFYATLRNPGITDFPQPGITSSRNPDKETPEESGLSGPGPTVLPCPVYTWCTLPYYTSLPWVHLHTPGYTRHTLGTPSLLWEPPGKPPGSLRTPP